MTLTTNAVFFDPGIEADFRRDGFVILPMLEREEVDALQAMFVKLVPELPSDFFTTLFLPDTPLRRALSAAVCKAAEPHIKRLMPGYEPIMNDFIAKRGSSNQPLPMHQDYTFADPTVYTSVHLWCPLLDVDEHNGCLKVVKGSHDVVNHISAIPHNPSPFDAFRQLLESECTTDVPMKAGSAFLCDERLLHASAPNAAVALRTVISGAYLPRGVRQRLYSVDPDNPSVFNIAEVHDQFAISLKPGCPMQINDPDRVTPVGSIVYTTPTIDPARIDALRVKPRAIPPQPAESSLPAASPKRSPGLVARLFGRG